MLNDDGRRVMIIGLDGATLDLIRPWAEAGVLPIFQKLFQQGASGPLRSIIPPLTPPAWSSFITGMNPGKHGVFDFTTRRTGDYDRRVIKSDMRQAPSLWQLASRAGKRVIVYKVPATYPPERVNGLMVSGLMTPDRAPDASYPPGLLQELQQAVPGITFGHGERFRYGHELELAQQLFRIHEADLNAARYLMARQPWDLFVMVFQHTDTAGHFFWRYMESHGAGLPESEREAVANTVREVYRDVDAKLGQLLEQVGEDTYVVVMSDHGHGPVDSLFGVNNWLLDKGYIRLKPDPLTQFKYLLYRLSLTRSRLYQSVRKLRIGNEFLTTEDERVITAKRGLRQLLLSFEDIDWSRTRAYSFGAYGPIFVNLRGREAQGIVEPGKEYEALLEQLKADLAQVKEPGTNTPFFAEIHFGREIYSGPYMDRAPDLLAFPRNWKYVLKGKRTFESNSWFTPAGFRGQGNHRMDGILFFRGPGIRPGYSLTNASVMDIAPTTLALLDVPIPEQMDGHVLQEAMTPGLYEQVSVTYAGEEIPAPDLVGVSEMSPEDEDLMVARLRDLGYIG